MAGLAKWTGALAGAVFLAGCGTTPAGPEQTQSGLPAPAAMVENEWRPITPFSFFICSETVDLTGRSHSVMSHTVGANGNDQYTVQVSTKGEGVGQSSGRKYEWNDAFHTRFHFGPGFTPPIIDIRQEKIHLVATGGGSSLLFQANVRLMFNANGELVVDMYGERDICI